MVLTFTNLENTYANMQGLQAFAEPQIFLCIINTKMYTTDANVRHYTRRSATIRVAFKTRRVLKQFQILSKNMQYMSLIG